jgi:glycerol uptake facilitator-like aquaporin
VSLRATLAEGLGTAFLVAIVVGSGIMGERLSAGNAAVALLANAVATGCGLATLIALFAPISGAHFNPWVTLVARLDGEMSSARLLAYVAAQCIGAILGVWLAHLMFDFSLWQTSSKVRTGIGIWTGEIVATFGLILLVRLGNAQKLSPLGGYIALYITAAYWFTSSTAFANPAVTIARSMSDTFAGIHPNSVLGFLGAQATGVALAMLGTKILQSR